MTDEELLKLSACTDGELSAAECREIESLLKFEPSAVRAQSIYEALDAAARQLPVPKPAFKDDEHEAGLWTLIRNREQALPAQSAERLEQLAAAEAIPVPTADRFGSMWKEISLHSFARKEMAPEIHDHHWNRVWSGISTRTAAVKEVEPKSNILQLSRDRGWMWAAGVGLAASVMLALWLPQSSPQTMPAMRTEPNATATAMVAASSASSMAIPETQDDHYGVRIRFVPGSSDPVVSLYYKTPVHENARNGLLGNDFNDAR